MRGDWIFAGSQSHTCTFVDVKYTFGQEFPYLWIADFRSKQPFSSHIVSHKLVQMAILHRVSWIPDCFVLDMVTEERIYLVFVVISYHLSLFIVLFV